MNLSSFFSGVVYKILSGVDLSANRSHQHEINGSESLRNFFSTSTKISGEINWHYFFGDQDIVNSFGTFTFYDARAKSFLLTGRSEWRMYYSGEFIESASEGDLLILVKTISGNIHGLVFQKDSNWMRVAINLFQINELNIELFQIPSVPLTEVEVEYSKQQIFEEIGIDFILTESDEDNEIARQQLETARNSCLTFPKSSTMSILARRLVKTDTNDSDSSLICWLEKEEKIFRSIEKILVAEKLKKGFNSVDDFINYSLSVQNRRKSRMGLAFQNHLEEIFKINGLIFETQKRTEGKNTPDFLFPGQKEYFDINYDPTHLAMLAAKSSCKERWAQILTEAQRIPEKHLCTLDQSISNDQIEKIYSNKIKLVIPKSYRDSYSPDKQSKILSLDDFISFVKDLQKDR